MQRRCALTECPTSHTLLLQCHLCQQASNVGPSLGRGLRGRTAESVTEFEFVAGISFSRLCLGQPRHTSVDSSSVELAHPAHTAKLSHAPASKCVLHGAEAAQEVHLPCSGARDVAGDLAGASGKRRRECASAIIPVGWLACDATAARHLGPRLIAIANSRHGAETMDGPEETISIEEPSRNDRCKLPRPIVRFFAPGMDDSEASGVLKRQPAIAALASKGTAAGDFARKELSLPLSPCQNSNPRPPSYSLSTTDDQSFDAWPTLCLRVCCQIQNILPITV